MPTFEIKSRWDGRVLYSAEGETLRDVVERAVRDGASLDGADLRDAYLAGASLAGASLDGADLRHASLRHASLAGASLDGADLRHASLVGSDLDGASLDGADLRDASLVGSDLDGASLRDANGNKLTLIGDRPILMIGPLGSRCGYLTAHTTDAGVYVRAGCFFGSLDEFRAAVTETHGDSNCGREYVAAIALIEAHAAVWAEPAVAEAA